ncbi:MAG: Two component regulator three Y domain-containing protein, partial [Croceitalea sp.]|nr:Two component regulator three Y domain-containing protein [Croceitalea sp.]
MPRNKTRRYLYAVLLVLSSIVVSSAVIKTNPYGFGSGMLLVTNVEESSSYPVEKKVGDTSYDEAISIIAAPMYVTIIVGANEEVTCSNDGSTLAKFFLCGTSDVRNVTLSQAGSSYEWQRLDPNTCAPTVVNDCPTINTSCNWDTVGTDASYNLSAAGEYRVRVDSGQYYYFKATQNPLDPQLIYEDIICGNQGRVEVTNVPNGYEYSLNSAAGPYQDDPFFDIASAGNYLVYVRLKDVSSSACIFPSNTVNIQDLDIDVQVTKNDIQCSGEQGSINVAVSGVPGFYTYRLIKNGVTVDTFGPNGADTYTFASVGSGIYSVRVQTNHCDITITTDVNGEPIEIGTGISPLDVSATASDSFGCGASTVDVDLETSGGTAPYRFSLDGGASFSTNYSSSTSFSVTTSGTYNLLIEDANGCQRTASVDVVDIPPPTFTTTAFDANCGGANDGQIVVNVTNSLGYNIVFSIDNGSTYQTSNVFSNLAAGSYEVMLRYTQDSFSCETAPQTETVGTPSSITANATADSNPTCANETGGQISITGVSGGSTPYEYSVGAGFDSANVFSNLGVGTYTPLIRDANGCVQTLPEIEFTPFEKPTNLDFAISSLDCISTTASVTLSVTNGTAPYTYEIIAPSASAVNNGTNDTFNGLGLGTYTFRVTDTEGCSYDENYAITDISSIGVQAQQMNPITCFGGSDGEGRFLVDGFFNTYSYSIDGGTLVSGQNNGAIDLSGLGAGNYTIEVTDEETNCTDTATLTIEGPTAALVINGLNIEDMNCQNGNVGSVLVQASGGWGGLSYALIQPDGSPRGPQNNAGFSGLTQTGTYQVEVTDLNGCTITDTFNLSALGTPNLTVDNAASDFCYDAFDAASLVVVASSGVAPYQYRINGGSWVGSSTFSGLNPGNYTIEVADDNDCRDVLSVTIAPQIVANATIIQELECSGPDAQIQVDISNGYPAGSSYVDYEVSINGGAFSTDNNPIVGGSFVYTVPNDGSITSNTTFRFRVSDSQSCTNDSNEVIITPQETISGTAQVTDTQCGDMTSGRVELIADTNQGIPPYQYSNDGGTTFSSQNIFSGYGPGTYSDFYIRDSRGCISTPISATILTSDPLNTNVTVTPATCSAPPQTLGGITANILNGVAPFDYEVFDITNTNVASTYGTVSTTETYTNLPPGDYTVVTTDASGCEDRDVVTIDQNQLDLIPLDPPPANCTDPFISYRVQAVGGTGPYEFRLVGDPTYVLANDNGFDIHDFSAVVTFGVTYFVEVRDALGCTYIEEIQPITPPSPIDISTTSTASSCSVAGTGEIYFEVTGIAPSPADFTITLENTDTGATVSGPTTYNNEPVPFNGSFTGLTTGNYQIIVNDLNTGCSASDLVLITENIPNIVVESNEPATCNTGALVTVRGSGGNAPYNFAYVPNGAAAPTIFSASTTFNIPGPYPADYDFYVEDANGCTNLVTATVTQSAGVPTPTINVVNQCTATSGYQVEVTSPLTVASSGPEQTFQYDIGSGYQDSPNFIVPNPGNYLITVRDGNGCSATVTAEVFDFFSISAEATSVPTCNAGDGVITVNTSGGSGNFEYQLRDNATLLPIGPPQNTNEFTGIAPGDYNVLVTDLSSNTSPLCSDTSVVNVATVDTPIISATPATSISCFGANDGTISVELQPGSDTDTPLAYTLYDGSSATIIAGPQSSTFFDNLASGSYQVEVESFRGCTDRSADIDISEPSALQVAAANTEFSCNPSSNQFNTATITVYTDTNGDGSGSNTGTGPYTYSINDGTPAFDGTNFQTSNTFEIIDNGSDQSIIVTVRDQKGCENTTTVNLATPTDITFSYAINQITCDVSGTGTDPGSIEIIIDQGPGNYQVDILPLGAEAPQNSGGTDRVNWAISTPGDYIFAVTDLDNGGCSYLTTVLNMPEFNTIEALIAEVKPVSCFNGNDGEISLEVNNYSGTYNYEVFSRNNAGVEITTGVTGSFDTDAPVNTPEIITGLPAGNLVVRIEALESPFCDVTSNMATVRSPDRALTLIASQTADVTCNEPGQGEITVDGDGGWGNYQYQLQASDGSIIVDYPNINPIFS